MTHDEAFHAGERAIQARFGVRDRLASIGAKVIRDAMPEQHRTFFEQLPFLIIGGLDARERVWASIEVGAPGFVRSPDDRTLVVSSSFAVGDPLAPHLAEDAPIGVLGIELPTRRRNRANGRVRAHGSGRLTIDVTQSFGNCPKYIHVREPRFVEDTATHVHGAIVREGPQLSTESLAIIARADTFFIASASHAPTSGGVGEGVDVSHRGGPEGFVRAIDDGLATTLLVPDYVGNFFFNTLGNIATNPSVGALFVDFATGTLLYVTGTARILWEDDIVDGSPRDERMIAIRVVEAVRAERALAMRTER